MKLYFVRHGESEANLLHEFSNRGFKHGLTERGFQQTEQLGLNLRGIPFTKIYTSPLKRAYQTAEILKGYLDSPLEISDALREFDCGQLEGKSDPESWKVYDCVFSQWLDGHWEARIPGGESHLDIQARFIPFIEGLIQNSEGSNALLVGHGGTYRCMLPLILKNVDFNFTWRNHIDHTSPIIAVTQNSGLFCHRWGETELINE